MSVFFAWKTLWVNKGKEKIALVSALRDTAVVTSIADRGGAQLNGRKREKNGAQSPKYIVYI